MSVPEGRPVFLSPHYDDAALSCGGTLAAMADAGERPLILTIFGGEPEGPLSGFALEMHRLWGLGPAEAVAHRRQEEARAAEILGVEAQWLDLPDAIYRGERYVSDEHLFGAVHPREATFYQDIREAILTFLQSNSIEVDTFYCPLGIGDHVDHQLVLATARTLSYQRYPVVAWEDYPYAGDPGVDVESVAQRRSRQEPVLRTLTSDQFDRRIRAIDCYASQNDVIFRFQGGDSAKATRTHVERTGSGVPAERFWPLAIPSKA